MQYFLNRLKQNYLTVEALGKVQLSILKKLKMIGAGETNYIKLPKKGERFKIKHI